MTLTCFHSPHHYSSSMKSFLFPPYPRRSLLSFSSVLCCKSSSASSCSVFHFCLEYLQHQSFCFNTVIFLIYFKRCNIFCSCACLMSLIGEKVQQSSTHLFGFCFFFIKPAGTQQLIWCFYCCCLVQKCAMFSSS